MDGGNEIEDNEAHPTNMFADTSGIPIKNRNSSKEVNDFKLSNADLMSLHEVINAASAYDNSPSPLVSKAATNLALGVQMLPSQTYRYYCPSRSF